ncbi:hypothetical protein WJR50_32845 [Catalinimonas sp. 4WD22]|uniref:hypothetical protein n=1 Tax=Catalinimonas locisalis TaxID=3133978 RepID=UPI003100FD22
MKNEVMTVVDFGALSLSYRAQYMWAFGRLIASRSESYFSYQLYHLGDYFAELKYNKADNKIDDIEGFTDTQRLNRYLDSVSLDQFL